MDETRPHNQCFLINIGNIDIKNVDEAIFVNEFIDAYICGIIYKVIANNAFSLKYSLENNSSSSLDVRYKYSCQNVSYILSQSHLLNSPRPELLNPFNGGLYYTIERYIEDAVFKFYMSEFSERGCLNIKASLINGNTLLISCEFLERS